MQLDAEIESTFLVLVNIFFFQWSDDLIISKSFPQLSQQSLILGKIKHSKLPQVLFSMLPLSTFLMSFYAKHLSHARDLMDKVFITREWHRYTHDQSHIRETLDGFFEQTLNLIFRRSDACFTELMKRSKRSIVIIAECVKLECVDKLPILIRNWDVDVAELCLYPSNFTFRARSQCLVVFEMMTEIASRRFKIENDGKIRIVIMRWADTTSEINWRLICTGCESSWGRKLLTEFNEARNFRLFTFIESETISLHRQIDFSVQSHTRVRSNSSSNFRISSMCNFHGRRARLSPIVFFIDFVTFRTWCKSWISSSIEFFAVEISSSSIFQSQGAETRVDIQKWNLMNSIDWH